MHVSVTGRKGEASPKQGATNPGDGCCQQEYPASITFGYQTHDDTEPEDLCVD
jgi:hypothetical protein